MIQLNNTIQKQQDSRVTQLSTVKLILTEI